MEPQALTARKGKVSLLQHRKIWTLNIFVIVLQGKCAATLFEMVNYFSFNSQCPVFTVAMLDMNISQFLKSLGLEHLRDIFEREQVSAYLIYPTF